MLSDATLQISLAVIVCIFIAVMVFYGWRARRAIARIEARFADWQGIENPRPDPDLGPVSDDRPISAGYFYDPEIYTIFTVDAVRPHTPVLDR